MKEVKVTIEYHWYCPKCERSCLSPYKEDEDLKVVHTCPDCGEKYQVKFKS